jgi:hypothetical protein
VLVVLLYVLLQVSVIDDVPCQQCRECLRDGQSTVYQPVRQPVEQVYVTENMQQRRVRVLSAHRELLTSIATQRVPLLGFAVQKPLR